MEAHRLKPIDRDWLRERKSILAKIRDQVRLYVGPDPDDIQHYKEAYKKDIERPWKESTMEALLAQLAQSQVLFGGDFHPFAQSQRAHLRVLRQIPEDTQVGLCLEVFPVDKQPIIDRFMSSELSEEEFLKEVCWEDCWGFPWSFYRPLVDLARQRGFQLYGLNRIYEERNEATLIKRDRCAAEKLRDIYQQKNEDLLYVIFGDLHIAQNHLPKEFCKLFEKDKPNTMSLYLNPEKVYFQLARKGLENKVDLVAYNQRHFAVVSSPPWVKWQNYLMYLEESYDEGIDDEVDFSDHVSTLVNMISASLQLEVDTNEIAVYSSRDHEVLGKAERFLNSTQQRIAKFLIHSDSSFYIPEKGFFYLSKPSVNHAASLAGQYVHARLANRRQLLWDLPNKFINIIWIEAMGFFLSKFVNPKRKAQTVADLKKQLAVFHPQDEGREPLLLALDQKMIELLRVYRGDERAQKFRPRKKSSYIEAARFLGAMLGQKYFALYRNDKISHDKILELLSFNPSDPAMADFYFNQLAVLDRLELEDGEFS